ncbi:MAG: DUF1492 domain-containing protein [Eubacterium sp.]|nr:DUF1492 domain-containing protein [Eubacterium sp.]
MTVKERMQQINIANRMIENKQEEIQHLHDLATRVTISVESERVQASGSNDKMADIICSATDLETELKKDISDLIKLRRQIMDEIDALENIDMIDLMYKRYFQCKKWEQIAEELHMSYRNVIRLHAKALKRLEEM